MKNPKKQPNEKYYKNEKALESKQKKMKSIFKEYVKQLFFLRALRFMWLCCYCYCIIILARTPFADLQCQCARAQGDNGEWYTRF